jgi:hypothetical protein
MRIAEIYSHLNGLEFLLVRKPLLWQEVEAVVAAVDASACKTKVSAEVRTKGKLFYSPVDMNSTFKQLLHDREWSEAGSAIG